MPSEFTYRRRVEFAETDAAGLVHFSAVFRYMEEAEHAFYRSLGGSAFAWTPDALVGMPRVEAGCTFSGRVEYADELDIRLVVREKRPKVIRYEVEIRRAESAADAEPVASGHMVVVHARRPHGAREWSGSELPAELYEEIEVAPARGPGP